MIGLIEIIVTLIKALVFLEKMGIPVEDVIAYFENMLGMSEEETTVAPEVVE
ncbi:MAG: hypothetical protein IKJ88_09950 [Clostridia bacterium]|nr:hypothetical protein [Clostridia bacterium]MBR3976165.1 hypothetical protein [Clostridia bacterium]